MQNELTIVLRYQRHAELVDGQHLMTGAVELQEGGCITSTDSFIGLKFHEMMTRCSRTLRKNPTAPVVIQRVDRPNLKPVTLQEELRLLLRDDPAQAISVMTVNIGQHAKAESQSVIKSAYDAKAEAFGETLYLRMRNGAVEDPTTGRWAPLAAIVKTGEFAVRGESNDSGSWLRISLPELGKPKQYTPKGVHQELSESLALCRWAAVDTETLLQQSVNKFFLPRAWNKEGQWVSRRALRERLDKFLKARKEAES